MHDSAEDRKRRRGHVQDKAVLKYLRDMIRICRYRNRRWLRMDYEQAWEFAAQIIYGPLPESEDFNTGAPPDSIISPLPAGFGSAHAKGAWPLRKIAKRFTRPYNTWQIHYETLECGHIVAAPVGYSVPAHSRRCAACLADKLAKKKKPVSADATAKAKAVGA